MREWSVWRAANAQRAELGVVVRGVWPVAGGGHGCVAARKASGWGAAPNQPDEQASGASQKALLLVARPTH